MKEISARVMAGLIALLTISSGFLNISFPETQMESSQLVAQGIAGLSNFRVGLGSPFLMAGLFAAFAALLARREALIPVMVFFACVLLARLVGFVAEGMVPVTVRFTALALVMLLVAAGAYRLFGNEKSA